MGVKRTALVTHQTWSPPERIILFSVLNVHTPRIAVKPADDGPCIEEKKAARFTCYTEIDNLA